MSTLSSEKVRTLHTAEVALRLIKFMAAQPRGLNLDEITKYLGKSRHTAYYLLNTLCKEGFAFQAVDKSYRLTTLAQTFTPPTQPALSLNDLKEVGSELHAHTHERVYLVVYGNNGLSLVDTWGKQGQSGPPGLKPTIREELHALAIGKAVFASLPKEVFDNYSQNIGLKRFTPYTKCDPEELWQELSLTHNEGVALDKEEFAEGFCCLAIPVLSDNGEIAALGMAVPTQRFRQTQHDLVRTLKQLHTNLTRGRA
jgi:DNA-binding IclR family transcriptional regulator